MCQGWTEDQIKNCGDFRNRSDFTPREKAALALAERMTEDSKGVDDTLWKEVRAHFDESEALELAVAIGLFNYFNIVNNALQMEPTK